MTPADRRAGFTLAEAIVSLVVASVGLALLFQLSAGAARLRVATDESAQVVAVAEARLAEARLVLTGPAELSGESGAIAWRIDAREIGARETGAVFLSLEVEAVGPSGRPVRLTSALALDPPEQGR